MLKIGDKTFMNLQEAVGWLLDNNALPFQSTANYIGNTEIAMSTLINPSPAKVRVGSLIFFADSKVSTVTGVTSNSFIVSDQYNDLVDDVVYVSNVALNASGHLIVTLSNGNTIDAGLIKQVSSFSIDASQHLIVSYNDGTSNDLGAIFSGNITISGNLTVTGGIAGGAITGDSIIENMSGYTFEKIDKENLTNEAIYAGAVKNGNKLTLVYYANLTRTDDVTGNISNLCRFFLPAGVLSKLIPDENDWLARSSFWASSAANAGVNSTWLVEKGGTGVYFRATKLNDLVLNTKYLCRFEITFLLSDNLAS